MPSPAQTDSSERVSPSVALVVTPAGHFLLGPATGGFTAAWRYRSPGLVLQTTWSGPDGELVVIDAMALGPRERGHDLGQSAPGVLLRQVRCTRGSVPLRVEYAPRPEFGLIHPRLAPADGAIVSQGGAPCWS